jgi:hypothetical protein
MLLGTILPPQGKHYLRMRPIQTKAELWDGGHWRPDKNIEYLSGDKGERERRRTQL